MARRLRTCYKNQHDERKCEYPKQRVDTMSPHGCKDVVELDVDGGEGEEAGDQELQQSGTIPTQSDGKQHRT